MIISSTEDRASGTGELGAAPAAAATPSSPCSLLERRERTKEYFRVFKNSNLLQMTEGLLFLDKCFICVTPMLFIVIREKNLVA